MTMPRRRGGLANRLITLAIGAIVLSACSGTASQSAFTAQPSTAASVVSASPAANTASPAAPTVAPMSATATPAPVSPSPGGPISLKSGTASIQFTVGSKKESLDLTLDDRPGLPGRIDEDGSVYAQWLGAESAGGIPFLSLQIPKGAPGTYVTDVAAGNMYVTFYADIIKSDVEHLSCKIGMKRTSTGGIAGTMHCKARLRVFLDPVTAKGTFSAEP